MIDAGRAPADGLLLLFRQISEPARRAPAWRLLDAGMGGRAWRVGSDIDVWELRDVISGDDEEPVAAAATCALGDGRRVRLIALVVAGGYRRRGMGRRTIDELVDALRARGVLVLVAAVPVDQTAAMATVRQGGLRPSHVERGDETAEGHDLVWFDVQL